MKLKITTYPEAEAFVFWDETNEEQDYVEWMSFKSSVIQKCIYSAMLIDQKQDLHHKIASIYEVAWKQNRAMSSQILPLIAFHYGRSRDNYNKLESLDEVSRYFFENGAYSEG